LILRGNDKAGCHCQRSEAILAHQNFCDALKKMMDEQGVAWIKPFESAQDRRSEIQDAPATIPGLPPGYEKDKYPYNFIASD
jgi:hypothetical protein